MTTTVVGAVIFFIGGSFGFVISAILPRKTKAEQRMDDEEQMKFIKRYNEDKNEWGEK